MEEIEKNEEEESESLVVGITGGIGTGKSSVARIIAENGYKIISTDDRAKEIMVTDENVKKKLFAEFGNEVYNSDGSLNASLLAEKVFGGSNENKKNLNKLNSIVHPVVIDDMIEKVGKLEAAGEKLIFVESALIFEAALDDGFDFIIVVHTPKEMIIPRLAEKFTVEQIEQRMSEQISQDEKVKWADFVVNNDSTPEDLKKSVELILGILKQLD